MTIWNECNGTIAYSSGRLATRAIGTQLCPRLKKRSGNAAQTHILGLVPGISHRTKMFRVTHFGTIGAKNLTMPKDRGPFFDHVRSINLLVQFHEGDGAAGGMWAVRRLAPDQLDDARRMRERRAQVARSLGIDPSTLRRPLM